MTQHGCDDGCATCAGHACAACVALDPSLPIASNCPHDAVEKHHGMRALVLDGPEPSRVPTKPLAPIVFGGSILIEVADEANEQLAAFFELVARVLRARGRAKLTVE